MIMGKFRTSVEFFPHEHPYISTESRVYTLFQYENLIYIYTCVSDNNDNYKKLYCRCQELCTLFELHFC